MKTFIPSEHPAEFIENLRAGDRAAFQQLYTVCYRALWKYASRILSDEESAEDLVAETFVKVWQQRETFESYQGLLKFCYVVTRNACLTWLRDTQRHAAIHKKLSYQQDKISEEIHQSLIRAELLQLILLESADLPPKMKEVFSLLFLEGLSLPEVALKMEVSIHTAKAQRAEALRKLRAALSRKGITGDTMTWLGF